MQFFQATFAPQVDAQTLNRSEYSLRKILFNKNNSRLSLTTSELIDSYRSKQTILQL